MSLAHARVLGAMLLVALIAWIVAISPRLQITTDVTRFMPTYERGTPGATRAEVVAKVLGQNGGDQPLVVQLRARARDEAELHRLAKELMLELRGLPGVKDATSGVDEDAQAELIAFFAALPPWTFLGPNAFTPREVIGRLEALRAKLEGVDAARYAALAPRDPLGSTDAALDALGTLGRGLVESRDGVLVSQDGQCAFVFVRTNGSAFDAEAQRPVMAAVRAWAAGAGVEVAFGGAGPYAVASESQIKADIARIGTLSTLGIVALFFLLFRHWALLGLLFIPLGTGCAAGILACHYWVGSIHGITLAFGTSLLGVGVDYIEHYYVHVALDPARAPRQVMRGVCGSLVAGAASTVLGLAGLLFSGVGGLQEMAIFAAAAVVAALLTTLFVVPPWMPREYRPPRIAAWLVCRIERLLRAIELSTQRSRRGLRWAGVGCGLTVAAAAVTLTTTTDEVQMLSADDGPHVAEDRAVRAQLAAEEPTALAAFFPRDAGAQLTELSERLEAARADGLLTGFPDLAVLVPGEARQRESARAARDSWPFVRGELTRQGFAESTFAPYRDALAGEASILSYEAWLSSPIGRQLGATLGLRTDVIALPLYGVRDLAALQAKVSDAAVILAPEREVRHLFGGARQRIVITSLLGGLAIFGGLWLRYRSARNAALAMVPVVISTCVVLVTLGALGVPLHILHILAFLLAASMSTDFGVFLVDRSATRHEAAGSLLSMTTAALTTVLSFGLLGLSVNAGLAALGYTVAFGVTVSLLVCPLVLVVFRDLEAHASDAAH